MNYLDELIVLSQNSNNIDKIMSIIGELGDIMLLKVDGDRDEKKYSVIITFSSGGLEPIRRDSESIVEGLIETIREYTSIRDQHFS